MKQCRIRMVAYCTRMELCAASQFQSSQRKEIQMLSSPSLGQTMIPKWSRFYVLKTFSELRNTPIINGVDVVQSHKTHLLYSQHDMGSCILHYLKFLIIFESICTQSILHYSIMDCTSAGLTEVGFLKLQNGVILDAQYFCTFTDLSTE